MAKGVRALEISRPLRAAQATTTQPESSTEPPSTTKTSELLPLPAATRPLSDIRELTEPSLIDGYLQHHKDISHHERNTSRASLPRRTGSMKREGSSRRGGSTKRSGSTRSNVKGADTHQLARPLCDWPSSSTYSTTPEAPEHYAIPQSSVPRRSSSFDHARQTSASHSRKPSIRAIPSPPLPIGQGFTVPNYGQSQSPVKDTRQRLDPITSERARRAPSRTVHRVPHPADILEFASYKHPRVKMEVRVAAPVFVGGGTVEGWVKVVVDENERLKQRRSLGISTLSVDLVGYEEVSASRRAIFLALGTELFDARHPPPSNMIQPANPLTPHDNFWTLSPSSSALPFMISLPLDTGPPPFQSKQGCIRFVVCATALIRDAGKHYRVRASQEVTVLPTHDPETALASLPTPLTVSDELRLPRTGGSESIKVTAGLHRQVWVSGSSIFVDVYIANRSRKQVKRLDLSLERDVLCYRHAAAATREGSAFQARISEHNQQSMIAMSSLRIGSSGWSGVGPHTSETRTCELELPRGHTTIRPGKYLEVRFFLNIVVSASNTKLVSLQLPITLVHMNSLDVVPNSVAQVAAAIEEKRAQHHRRRSSAGKPSAREPVRQRSVSSPAHAKDLRRRPSYSQGRAFAAPRQQSTDRRHAERADMAELCGVLDSSPRKNHTRLQGFALKKVGSDMSFANISMGGKSGEAYSFSMVPKTPEPRRPHQRHDDTAERVDSIRDRMKRMRSFDSLHSKKSTATAGSRFGPWHENVKPSVARNISQLELAPHTLGLTSAEKSLASSAPVYSLGRPATAQSFRDRRDRSRFEFKAVRRKASVTVKERSMALWDHMKYRGRETEDWI